jgi:hypothetical protein
MKYKQKVIEFVGSYLLMEMVLLVEKSIDMGVMLG